ncbi:30S ribosomal protein S4 [Candidatus Solincola tengchongensis]|uniref:30S ribosomal protein S4 n=1 Tax=Candidatus Solincola tengchongensis TaxID=2900693 RepID=UPI002580FDF4|nr:30S ribosomal protein S4 [Candidatus Solincola tengchongensis]
MARNLEPSCKQCRREGVKLFLKGARCESDKCAMERRAYPPGEHGRGRVKETEYLLQLREKQKAKRIYGVLERQFRNYYGRASRQKGITGENLLALLESRLDNVVYRGGLASSRQDARQLVRHGHVTVNGRKVDIPSYEVKVGDVIELKEKSRDMVRVLQAVRLAEGRPVVPWLRVDLDKRRIEVVARPRREDIDIPVKEHLIVELYSK